MQILSVLKGLVPETNKKRYIKLLEDVNANQATEITFLRGLLKREQAINDERRSKPQVKVSIPDMQPIMRTDFVPLRKRIREAEENSAREWEEQKSKE